MGNEKIAVGETRIGMGPYTIDDVTNNAVIVLCRKGVRTTAVMNLGIMDAPASHEAICDFVRMYNERLGSVGGPENIEATVIGGEFREHTAKEGSKIVYFDFHLARREAEDALAVCGVIVRYIQTERLATKMVTVGEEGHIEFVEQKMGLNRSPASISLEDYNKAHGGGY
jgi:hypothetical protein